MGIRHFDFPVEVNSIEEIAKLLDWMMDKVLIKYNFDGQDKWTINKKLTIYDCLVYEYQLKVLYENYKILSSKRNFGFYAIYGRSVDIVDAITDIEDHKPEYEKNIDDAFKILDFALIKKLEELLSKQIVYKHMDKKMPIPEEIEY